MPRAIKRSLMIDRARELYAGGMGIPEIARLLEVSGHTLRDWRRYDRGRGRSWEEELGLAHALHPERVLRALERRFGRMVMEAGLEGPEDPEERKEYERRLLNMTKIINAYRRNAPELTLQLRTLEEFSLFCTENLTSADLAPVRRALEQFVNHLREENR